MTEMIPRMSAMLIEEQVAMYLEDGDILRLERRLGQILDRYGVPEEDGDPPTLFDLSVAHMKEGWKRREAP